MTRIFNKLAMAVVATVVATGAAGQQTAGVRQHVEYLAADELGGRLTGTDGAHRAAEYLSAQLEQLGARPLPGLDDFRHAFEFTAGARDSGSELALVDGASWGQASVQALSFSDDATVSGDLVFAGYGLAIPESQGYPYDSYFGLDLDGKIAVVLRYLPEDVDAEARAILSRYSGLRYKAMQARERGAVGLLVVTGPRSPNAGELVAMTFDTAAAGSGIAAASLAGEAAEALMSAAGRDLAVVQAELDTGNPHVSGFELGVRAELRVAIERERRVGANVVGYLPATAPSSAAKPWLVLGAHYDHLGDGRGGNSLAREGEAGEIHNGADDNASGVAAVLAAGAQLRDRDRARNIVLAFWSGEELGLLGSTAFVREPVLDPEQIAAYLNFDMVGRSRNNRLVLQAVGSSAAWPSLIERSNVPVGFDIATVDDPNLPTDSSAFNQVAVPTLAFFTESHGDYHRPSDDADQINYEDLERVARLGALIAGRVDQLPEPPEFVAVATGAASGGDRDTVRVFTGTIPDYASDVEGLLLGGVIEGGPAAAAGLRGGDVIVEFGGQKIANIYDYTFALDAVKIDEPLQVVYIRDGERFETTLTPTARR